MDYEDELERMKARRQGRRPSRTARQADPEKTIPGTYNQNGGYDPYRRADRNYDGYNEYDEYGQPDGYDFYRDEEEEYGGYGPYDEEDVYDRPRTGKKKGGFGTAKRSSVSSQSGRSAKKKPARKQPGNRSGKDKTRNARLSKKKSRKRKILLAELVVLVLLLGFAFFFFKKKGETGYWTVAVFGVDSRDGNLKKGALSDVEMICNINRATGEIQLVSVYRDTYVKINSKGTYHKINEAYAKGGPDQGLYALNENLDLNIKDYATFNWKAVADAINILGGIDIEITDKEFAYINSFITETVESTGIGSYHLKSAGMNHLDGVQAVAYSRLRLMDTDFNRTERQRKVVSLAMEKAKQADLATLTTLVRTIFPQVATNVGLDDLLAMATNVSKYHISETTGFPFARGTTKIGRMDCVIPQTLESNVIQLHQLLYPDTPYSPSSNLKKISGKIAEDSGMGEVGKNAETGSKNSSGGGKKQPAETPAETVPETIPETEETTQEVTIEETTEETVETSTEEIGPGIDTDKEHKPGGEETKPVEKPTEPPETSASKPDASQEKPSTDSPGSETSQGGPGEKGPGV